MPDLSDLDLWPVQAILSISAALLAMWVMQCGHVTAEESGWLRFLRRLGTAAVAVGFLWSVSYAWQQNWQPWPPYILVLVGANLAMLASVAASLRASRKR